jgi:hypothetical protein
MSIRLTRKAPGTDGRHFPKTGAAWSSTPFFSSTTIQSKAPYIRLRPGKFYLDVYKKFRLHTTKCEADFAVKSTNIQVRRECFERLQQELQVPVCGHHITFSDVLDIVGVVASSIGFQNPVSGLFDPLLPFGEHCRVKAVMSQEEATMFNACSLFVACAADRVFISPIEMRVYRCLVDLCISKGVVYGVSHRV